MPRQEDRVHQRRDGHAHEEVRHQAGRRRPHAANGDVEFARGEIDHLVRHVETHRQIWSADVEIAQPAREPVGRQGARRRDAEDRVALGSRNGEGFAQRGKGLGHARAMRRPRSVSTMPRPFRTKSGAPSRSSSSFI